MIVWGGFTPFSRYDTGRRGPVATITVAVHSHTLTVLAAPAEWEWGQPWSHNKTSKGPQIASCSLPRSLSPPSAFSQLGDAEKGEGRGSSSSSLGTIIIIIIIMILSFITQRPRHDLDEEDRIKK
jgi:hypothetical protein